MAAEELPLEEAGWELEAWYQDLQEVLAAAEPAEPSPAWAAEQAELALPCDTELAWGTELAVPWGTELAAAGPPSCELDAALAAELLQLLGPEGTAGAEAAPPAGTTCPAPQQGTQEQEPEPRGAAAAPRGLKRKRSREAARRQEQAGEQRLQELRAHNQRLQEQLRRLSAEVAQARAALIDRILSLRRP